jgi:hypothetical protein
MFKGLKIWLKKKDFFFLPILSKKFDFQKTFALYLLLFVLRLIPHELFSPHSASTIYYNVFNTINILHAIIAALNKMGENNNKCSAKHLKLFLFVLAAVACISRKQKRRENAKSNQRQNQLILAPNETIHVIKKYIGDLFAIACGRVSSTSPFVEYKAAKTRPRSFR